METDTLFELSPGSGSVPSEVNPANLEYGYVESCTSAPELLALLRELQSGKHGLYPDLEKSIEERLLKVMSDVDRKRYIALKGPTRAEEDEARASVNSWMSSMSALGKKGAAADAENSEKRGAAETLPPVRGAPRGALGQGSSSKAAPAAAALPAAADEGAPSKKIDSKAKPFKDFYGQWDKFDVDAALSDADKQVAEEVRARDFRGWPSRAGSSYRAARFPVPAHLPTLPSSPGAKA